jgi:hypothetical protein
MLGLRLTEVLKTHGEVMTIAPTAGLVCSGVPATHEIAHIVRMQVVAELAPRARPTANAIRILIYISTGA